MKSVGKSRVAGVTVHQQVCTASLGRDAANSEAPAGAPGAPRSCQLRRAAHRVNTRVLNRVNTAVILWSGQPSLASLQTLTGHQGILSNTQVR